ncbi:MAG: PAS domain S-box protein [bacterium]
MRNHGGRVQIVSSNLPFENFVWRVEAQPQLGEWSTAGEISATTHSSFWASWWFIALFLLFLGAVITFIVYWRTKSLEKQRAKLEKTIEERTRDLRKLSLVASETDNAVIIADADGLIEWVNQGFTRMYGLTLQELKDSKGEYISVASDNPDIEATLQTALHEKKSVVYDSVSRTRDGRELYLSSTLTPIFDQNGDLESIVIIDTDITELKRQEKALRLTQFSVDRAGDAVFWVKPGGQFFYANQTACLSLGYEKEELLAMKVLDITDVYDVYEEGDFEETWNLIKQSGTSTFESRHIRKDGHVFPVEVTANYLRFDEQEYICAFARDIGERKQAENALRESQERFHLLAESAFEGIGISDGDRIIDANKRLAEMFGYSYEDLIGKNFLDFVAPECREMVRDYRNQGHEEAYEHLAVRKDGSLFTVEVQSKSISYDGRMVRVAAIRDITERKGIEQELTALNELLLNNEKKLSAANRQLSASLEQVKAQERVLRAGERKYRSLFNQIADPIFIFAKDSRKFLDCNNAVHRIYGYSKQDLTSMTPLDLHPPEDLEKVKENVDKRNVDKANSYTHVTKEGRRIAVEILTDEIDYQGCPAWMSIVRDITERKEAADELKQLNEKLKNSQHDLSAANQELVASLE